MKRVPIICFIITMALFTCTLPAAATGQSSDKFHFGDTTLSAEIRRQLGDMRTSYLYFPETVKRFYRQNGFQPAWLKNQSGTGPTWQAMMMIDCVLQFGLSHADYHPDELRYDQLHQMLDHPSAASVGQQARFEIMLSDAMINLANNLHFGKLNPYYSNEQIDEGNAGDFSADIVLATALQQKDLMAVIENVQPACKAYAELQRYMKLRVGLQSGDCYEVPEAEIRKIAINMERLRWAAIGIGPFIQINIPTYTLTLNEPDSIYDYKVVVGKPDNPTPELNSKIDSFTTSPDWKVPGKIFREDILPNALADAGYLENSHFSIYDNKGNYVEPSAANLALVKQHPGNYRAMQSAGCDNALGQVVFRFANSYAIYLHDTPEKQLFSKQERDFSHGCVRVERAATLAATLLQYDGQGKKLPSLQKAIRRLANANFALKTAVPLKITYITCAVGQYGLITYNDVYDLDNRLEMALYHPGGQLAKR